jgi:hypothetical protein
VRRLAIPLKGKNYGVDQYADDYENLSKNTFGDIEKWLAQFIRGHNHLVNGLRIYNIHPVLQPLPLCLCEQMILPSQLILAVILCDYYSDE